MQEQLISFEIAKLAKEKGFPQLDCQSYLLVNFNECVTLDILDQSVNLLTIGDLIGYKVNNKTVSAPTQSLLQKWLREKYHLIIIVEYQYEYGSTPYSYWIYKENDSLPINQWVNNLNTYEEALEAGLQKALSCI